MTSPAPTAEVTVYLHHETEKAVLISEDGFESAAKWIPKSRIRSMERIGTDKGRHIVTLELEEWLAQKEGLI